MALDPEILRKMQAEGYDVAKYLNPPEESGSSILKILSYLDRPRNTIASGVAGLTDDDPTTGFFGQAY
ncbi:MAG: hypothetical protein GF364_22865, partial [Candidatus Lokiarchaeota archaeon]|nr:hypothetical protein [Candidatus Lokiarchaeota archaeon]